MCPIKYICLQVRRIMSYNIIDRFGNVFHILRVQSANVNASIGEQVNFVLLYQHIDLGLVQARVGEHPNLLSYVHPGARSLELLEVLDQCGTHLFDPR
jgi:hypothetical protein